MDSFIKELREQDLIKEFDARLWGSLVDFITIYSKDDIRVTHSRTGRKSEHKQEKRIAAENQRGNAGFSAVFLMKKIGI